jgi:hypothetical protein
MQRVVVSTMSLDMRTVNPTYLATEISFAEQFAFQSVQLE